MMLYLVTKNPYKVAEIQEILSHCAIQIKHLRGDKYEPKEMSIEEVALYNAEKFYKKIKKPVIIEDTGIFFHAFPKFPGNHPKLMYHLLGYRGLLKLLENEKRSAFFRSAVAFCDGNSRLFTGELRGEIAKDVHCHDKEIMAYERIFLYEGRRLCDLSREEKNSISHRAMAFHKLGTWLSTR